MPHSIVKSEVNKNLSNEQRRAVVHELLIRYKNGKLKYGAIKCVFDMFMCGRVNVWRLWKVYLKGKTSGNAFSAISSKIKVNSGRKPISKRFIESKVFRVPFCQRGHLRNLAFATGISVSTLSRAKSRGVILKQSKTLKPNLTVQNKES